MKRTVTAWAAMFTIGSLLVAGCGASSGDKAAFCREARQFIKLSSVGGSADLPKLKAQATQLRQRIDAAVKAAPGEIRDDAKTLQKGFGQIIDTVTAAKTQADLEKKGDFLQRKLESLSGPLKHLFQYFQKNCAVEDTASSDTASVSDATSSS